MDLKTLTIDLNNHLDTLKERYMNNEQPKDRRDKTFFEFVKRETTPIYDLLGTWEEVALETVKNREIKTHPHQVTATKENMELLLMHSYYMDAKEKRYMELNHSVQYIFNQIINQTSHGPCL